LHSQLQERDGEGERERKDKSGKVLVKGSNSRAGASQRGKRKYSSVFASSPILKIPPAMMLFLRNIQKLKIRLSMPVPMVLELSLMDKN
jgi:hypothetical protein